MKDAKMVWDKQCEDVLEQMVSIFRKSIITDAEIFSTLRSQNTVTAQGLEIALYKSVMTLNEFNKAILFKKIGPYEATILIKQLEERAIQDVCMGIIDDLEENYNNLPPEVKKIVDLIRESIKRNKNKE